MTSRISGIVPLLLITLICIGCVEGGYLLLEHFVLDAPVVVESNEAVPLAKASETKKDGAKTQDYRIILQRNLFGPPPVSGKDGAGVETPVPVEALAATNLEVVLMGTITGSKGVERAIILDKKSQEQEMYEKGDSLHGAVVKNIERGKVIISREGKDEILDMIEAAKVRPPPPPPTKIEPVVAGGQGNLPVRAIPQPPAGIDPITGGGDNPAPVRPASVERVKRSLVPQRIYRPSPPPRRQ